MRIVYYADDETEFESEAACLEYEKHLTDLCSELYQYVHAFDSNGNAVNFDAEYLDDAFQDAVYLQFDSKKAIEAFAEKASCFGLWSLEEDLRRPVAVGERYFYDWGKDKWKCLEDERKELNKIANIFNCEVSYG